MSKRAKIWFGIFLISFLPYLYIVWVSIVGMEFSWFFSTEYLLGAEAVCVALFFGCVIPVYPIVLIFQIIYIFLNRRKLTKVQKKIMISAYTFVISVTALACAGHAIKEYVTIRVNYKKDQVAIEEYFRENYGDAFADGMYIEMPKQDTYIYSVSTPLMKSKTSVWLHEETREVTLCGLEGDYMKEVNLDGMMGKHLSKQWGMPENMQLNVKVEDIDLRMCEADELPHALLDTCEYWIDGWTMECSSYEEEQVVEKIEDFLKEYKRRGILLSVNGYFKFYVCVNGEYHASIVAYPVDGRDDKWELHFDGYSNKNGRTIEDKVIHIEF